MKTRFVEVTNGSRNWGKFLVGQFDHEETIRPSHISPELGPLLPQIGWRDHGTLWVFDLQTREGAAFKPGGHARADLNKHRVWVCPLFEPFLTWLYEQDLTDLETLPGHVDLPDADFGFSGYRRPGMSPGEFLKQELVARSMTQKAFADTIRRPPQVINEIVSSKKTITLATALDFEKVLGLPAEFWLDLQTRYQLAAAREGRTR